VRASKYIYDKPARKVIKQVRWPLLRSPENLKREEQRLHLQDLSVESQSLIVVYLFKAELKTLWSPVSAPGLAG